MYEARRHTAFVFQNYNLFLNKTALQNVTEGLIVARKLPKEQADEIGMKMLAKVGRADRADYYPRQLSGGQQQRVLLARALCAANDLLILDEPVTGLDPASMQDLYKTLRFLNEREGMAIIMVTHDIENALREAKHILCVDRAGCFYGTVDEFLSSPAGKRFGGERA